jgi:death-on-curing protein
VLDLYQQVLQHTGGAVGVRDLNGLESAIAQPRMTFGGAEHYPTIVEKASALGFSLVMNHPFVDGHNTAVLKKPALKA